MSAVYRPMSIPPPPKKNALAFGALLSNQFIFQAIFFTKKCNLGEYLYVSHTLFRLYLESNHTLFGEK